MTSGPLILDVDLIGQNSRLARVRLACHELHAKGVDQAVSLPGLGNYTADLQRAQEVGPIKAHFIFVIQAIVRLRKCLKGRKGSVNTQQLHEL